MKDNIGAIQKVVEEINNNPEELPSAVEASRSVGYERSYLSKLFKQVTGITFNAYSNIIKMGFAAVQLRDTEMPVSEIALRLGYSGQDAFTHAFTNVYRCSPTEYRKNPDIISVPFFKIINIENKGVMTMKKIDPANIIGDGFLQLLELQPASIIMYCFLANFAVSPTGMLRNYNPTGNKLPCIGIDSSVAEMLPLSMDEIFRSIIELADVDLLKIVNMENGCFYVAINPIPEKLVSNGTVEDFVDFVKSQSDR